MSVAIFVVLLAQSLVGWTAAETEHFRINVPPGSKVDPAAFGVRQERALQQLRAFFEVTLPGRIDYYVWNSADEARRTVGRTPGFALPAELKIHVVPNQTPGHELTHVLVFHAIQPERSASFVEEGTAAAFDLTNRDRLALARDDLQRAGVRLGSVLELWQHEGSNPLFYTVGGAFMERLLARGGRERFLALLKRQTLADARTIYGADLNRIAAEFDADLGTQSPAPSASPASPAPAQTAAAPENPDWPSLDTLRARAQERMRRDLETLSREQLQQLETLYQSANRNLNAPGSKDVLREVIQKFPRSNRAGCAAMYLAMLADPADSAAQEKLLLDAIQNYSDAMFGDGVQVGAMARANLAAVYARNGRTDEAKKLAAEVDTLYPGAVDHRGRRLAEGLRRLTATGGI